MDPEYLVRIAVLVLAFALVVFYNAMLLRKVPRSEDTPRDANGQILMLITGALASLLSVSAGLIALNAIPNIGGGEANYWSVWKNASRVQEWALIIAAVLPVVYVVLYFLNESGEDERSSLEGVRDARSH